jgi:hypothetical protein
MTLSQSRLRPSRRSIVKGAAWAVPVVVAATAAPAAAQSACTPSTVFNSLPVGQCVTKPHLRPVHGDGHPDLRVLGAAIEQAG